MKTILACLLALCAPLAHADEPITTPARIAMQALGDKIRGANLAIHLLGVDTEDNACELFIYANNMVYVNQTKDGRVVADGVFNPYWAITTDHSNFAQSSTPEGPRGEQIRAYVTVTSTIDRSAASFNVSLEQVGSAAPKFRTGSFLFDRGAQTMGGYCQLKVLINDNREILRPLLTGLR